ARVPRSGNERVEAVDRAQQRGLAATGWPYERRDRMRCDVERHVVQRARGAVPEREVADGDPAAVVAGGVAQCRAALRSGGRGGSLPRGEDTGHPNRPVMYASVRGSEGLVNNRSVGASSTISPARKNAVRSDTRAACC